MKVIKSESLSSKWEARFICVDEETGEVLDDAQGYGYKSPQRAHAAFVYKNRSKEQKGEYLHKKAIVNNFLRSPNGKEVLSRLEDIFFYGYKDNLPEKEIKKEVSKYLDTIGFDFNSGITKQFFLKQAEKK